MGSLDESGCVVVWRQLIGLTQTVDFSLRKSFIIQNGHCEDRKWTVANLKVQNLMRDIRSGRAHIAPYMRMWHQGVWKAITKTQEIETIHKHANER